MFRRSFLFHGLMAGALTLWGTGIAPLASAQTLGPLAQRPDWSRLKAYEHVRTRAEVTRQLEAVYSIDEAHRLTLRPNEEALQIRTSDADQWHALPFRPPEAPMAPPQGERYWRTREEILQTHARTPGKPLTGLRLVLDPGHLGGRWARMEERWFRMGPDLAPVTEGDMTLQVAKLLKPRLEALGAVVKLTRTSSRPVTKRRPRHFQAQAEADLRRMGVTEPRRHYRPSDPPEARWKTIQWHAEKYFYRVSEIRERARLVNTRLQPDLALCLHFNAEAWGDPQNPAFVPRNHFHLLINGAYSLGEMGREDERFGMLLRLLQGTHAEERALAETMAIHMARTIQLPAYTYTTNNVMRPSGNPYVYARNLLANRLFECPVIYFEPYVMNCQDVHDRVQAGFYEGTRVVAGKPRPSLYHEYASGVVQGLVAHYGTPAASDS